MGTRKNARNSLSRRQCLKVLAASGAAAGLAWRFRSDRLFAGPEQAPEVIHESHFLMGTVLTMTLVSDDPDQAKTAATAALTEMTRLVGIFSRFDTTSQLSQLNTYGLLRSPDPALVGILKQAFDVQQASDGAFDITVKPLLELYQDTLPGSLPSPAEVHRTLKLVGAEKLVFDEREIGFAVKGMGLTLDGIAKGAVIDGGVRVLRQHGFSNVIVEAGGDLFASGSRSAGTPWKIGVRSPRFERSTPMPRLNVQNQAVATSGDYLQCFTPDHSAHHILDPRQGISSPELASATVIGPSAVLADALATAIMVAGVKDGLEILQQFPGCEAYLVDKQLQVVSSPGLERYLV